ncbi:MAG: MFS transporter [Caulobacter sp.]|nr:MFS transporter [Caulobacter sp.]
MTASARLFLMMVLQLAIWGAWAPKIFPYMGMLGFAPWQQSLVGSSWGVAAVVGIFFSNQFADRNFAAERFLAVSHLIGGLALVGTALSTSFWPFFACYLIFSLVYVPTLSVTNSIAFANLRDPAADFGAVRMGGTVGWVLVSWPFVFLLGAHAGAEQVRWIFLVAAILSFVFAGYALTLPHTPARKDAPGIDNLAWRRALKLLGAPFVLVLFLVTFIDSVIHNGYFVMADAFLTNRVGIAGIVAVQLLHGICYAFFFATVYIFVDAVFPKDVRSSAQGLFNLLILGVGNVVASFLFPTLVSGLSHAGADGAATVDYTSLFLVPTGMALVAVLLLALFFKPPTRGPVGQDVDETAPVVADGLKSPT